MRLSEDFAACWPESCLSGSPDATANSYFFLGVADGAFAPEAWLGNGVPTLPWNRADGLHLRACFSPRTGGSARVFGSWSFLNLQFLLGGSGPDVAVVANAWRNDGDGLRRRGIAVEEFGVHGSVGPTSAEALGAGSIGGPSVMRSILEE